MSAVSELLERWRADAAVLRRNGAEHLPRVAELHAAELSAALHADADELLTLQRAAAESGYTTRHLWGLDAAGQLENRGRKGAPLYRRGDLPRKPGAAQSSAAARTDATSIVRSLRRA